MNEEMVQQMMATAERLASAAESLDRVLGRLDAQQEALNAKVDRIVAAVESSRRTRPARRRGGAAIAGASGGAGEVERGPEGAGGADGAEDAAADGVGDPGEELR